MPNQQDKLSSFIQSIMQDVKKESQEITERCASERESVVSAASDQYLSDAYSFIRAQIAEIQTLSGQAISKKALENNREIFLYRQDMKKRILADVTEKVAAFTASDAYDSALFAIVQDLFSRVGDAEARLYLRGQDLHFADVFKKAFPGLLSVEASISVTLGGAILETADHRIRLDASYDSAFSDIDERFFELISVL